MLINFFQIIKYLFILIDFKYKLKNKIYNNNIIDLPGCIQNWHSIFIFYKSSANLPTHY